MQIECTTTNAAAQVLFILADAHMRPGQEFYIAGPQLPDPPILFSLHVSPLPHVVRRLQGVPDASIASKRAD